MKNAGVVRFRVLPVKRYKMPRTNNIFAPPRLTVTQQRARDRERMRKRRENEAIKSIERERNRIARRERREDEEYRSIERERCRIAQRKRRENEEYRSIERERDRIAHRERREDEEYRSIERERNRTAHRKRCRMSRRDEESGVERELQEDEEYGSDDANGRIEGGQDTHLRVWQLHSIQDKTTIKQVGETSIGVDNEDRDEGVEATYPRIECELQIKVESEDYQEPERYAKRDMNISGDAYKCLDGSGEMVRCDLWITERFCIQP